MARFRGIHNLTFIVLHDASSKQIILLLGCEARQNPGAGCEDPATSRQKSEKGGPGGPDLIDGPVGIYPRSSESCFSNTACKPAGGRPFIAWIFSINWEICEVT